MFGRAGEEMLALAEAGIPFRIVSGVTAGLAGPVAALIPPTLRGVNQAVIFATGHGAGEGPRIDWATLAATRQPLVIYMAMNNLADDRGRARSRAALRPTRPPRSSPRRRCRANGSSSRASAGARTMRDDAGIAAPAMVVIGEIVATRDRLLGLAGDLPEDAP